MRGLLLLLAACSGGWKQTAASEPEPDSRTEYAPQPVTGQVTAKKTCHVPRHATPAGLTIVVTNASTYAADLCRATDQAIGLLQSTNGLGGFQLDVTLQFVKQAGVKIECRVAVGVNTATGARIGAFAQVVTAQASSIRPADIESSMRDCVDANIDDLVRPRAVPAMLRYAGAGPSSP